MLFLVRKVCFDSYCLVGLWCSDGAICFRTIASLSQLHLACMEAAQKENSSPPIPLSQSCEVAHVARSAGPINQRSTFNIVLGVQGGLLE